MSLADKPNPAKWRRGLRSRRVLLSAAILAFGVIAIAGSFSRITSATPRNSEVTPAPDPVEAWFLTSPQGPELNYSTFKHSSAKHASLGCNDCHQRNDNSIRPTRPGHPACVNCHTNQFVTPVAQLCQICHTDVSGAPPPMKPFPTDFKESFNVKFDHSQHNTGAARPKAGCASCHDRPANRAGLAIPTSINAHTECYTCHTPGSKSAAGRDLASCNVCHDMKAFRRTPTTSRAFSESFSHAQHGARQHLECAACHSLTAGAAQGRQVSSTRSGQHFPSGAGQNCSTCHNGKRSFGGDLGFKDCDKCHTGGTFRFRT